MNFEDDWMAFEITQTNMDRWDTWLHYIVMMYPQYDKTKHNNLNV